MLDAKWQFSSTPVFATDFQTPIFNEQNENSSENQLYVCTYTY